MTFILHLHCSGLSPLSRRIAMSTVSISGSSIDGRIRSLAMTARLSWPILKQVQCPQCKGGWCRCHCNVQHHNIGRSAGMWFCCCGSSMLQQYTIKTQVVRSWWPAVGDPTTSVWWMVMCVMGLLHWQVSIDWLPTTSYMQLQQAATTVIEVHYIA